MFDDKCYMNKKENGNIFGKKLFKEEDDEDDD